MLDHEYIALAQQHSETARLMRYRRVNRRLLLGIGAAVVILMVVRCIAG